MKKNTFLNLAISFLYQILNLLVGLFLPKLYTEVFGSVYNGLNQSLSQVMNLFSVLQLGISAVSIQQMFKFISENNTEMINAIYQDAAIQYRQMGYIFLIAAVLVILFYPFVLEDGLPYEIVVAFFLLRCISSAIEYFFQAKYTIILVAHNRSYYIYGLNIALLLLSAALHMIVLYFTRNILLYQTVSVVIAIIRMLIVRHYIKERFPFLSSKSNIDYCPPKHAQRKHVLVSEIAGLIIDGTDLVLLSSFSTLVNASIYSVYFFVTSGINNILNCCREAVFAGVGKLLYSDFEEYNRRMNQFESIYFFLTFFLYTTTILLYRPFIVLYTENMDANYVLSGLPILFVLARLIVNFRIPAIMTINAAGHFEQVKHYAVTEAVINLVVSLALVEPCGIYGVLLGTILGALYRTPILIHYASVKIRRRSSGEYWGKIALWLPIISCAYFLSFAAPIKCDSFLMWVCIASLVTVVVFLICVIWLAIFDRNTLRWLFRVILKK